MEQLHLGLLSSFSPSSLAYCPSQARLNLRWRNLTPHPSSTLTSGYPLSIHTWGSRKNPHQLQVSPSPVSPGTLLPITCWAGISMNYLPPGLALLPWTTWLEPTCRIQLKDSPGLLISWHPWPFTLWLELGEKICLQVSPCLLTYGPRT